MLLLLLTDNDKRRSEHHPHWYSDKVFSLNRFSSRLAEFETLRMWDQQSQRARYRLYPEHCNSMLHFFVSLLVDCWFYFILFVYFLLVSPCIASKVKRSSLDSWVLELLTYDTMVYMLILNQSLDTQLLYKWPQNLI